jgi:hypothetical protein
MRVLMLNYLGILYIDLFIYNLLNCFSFFTEKGALLQIHTKFLFFQIHCN